MAPASRPIAALWITGLLLLDKARAGLPWQGEGDSSEYNRAAMIVDSAVYADGRRMGSCSLKETRQEEACRARDGFVWVDLREPTQEEFRQVAREFDLHELAVGDTIKAHQRPKIERYDETLFVVLKTAHYLDEAETVEFGEIHLFVGPDFVVTDGHGKDPELDDARRQVEGNPAQLRRGSAAVLHAVLDRVVGDYAPVVEGLQNDIDEIEAEVFGGDAGVSRRIYELSREVIQFHRATQPLAGALGLLIEGDGHGIDPELRRYLRDVRDHVLRVTEQVEGFRDLLTNILSVNLTLVGINQNDQTKKVSAWAAILVVPTIITGIYGMNFDQMPELHWTFGYPFSLALMALLAALLYRGFKRSGWL